MFQVRNSLVNKTFAVNVKWGKEVYKGIEVNLEEDVLTFRTQIYCLSNVPVDKQKIMIKGVKGPLKDTDDLKKCNLKKDMTIMMMGTAEDKGLKEPE